MIILHLKLHLLILQALLSKLQSKEKSKYIQFINSRTKSWAIGHGEK